MLNAKYRIPVSIELAERKDVTEVMRIISHCNRDMRANAINQWDPLYPSLRDIVQDAQSHSLFIIRQDGLCIASVSLNDSQPEEYRTIPWRCVAGRALVVHRLCVHPHWQRRGFGSRMMEFAESFACNHDFSCIRLDAYTGNPQALALYERLDYQRVGQVFFPRRELSFACFEKKTNKERFHEPGI